MTNLLKFQKALDKVSEVSPLLIGEAQDEFKRKSEEFLNYVQDFQYVKVPLVGGFNAGKSSLLNVFTQKPGMLPVDTQPETAVAYELYYSTDECVELYRNGSKIDTKPLSNIKQLDTKPGDIAKVYCTSEPVKELQGKGIILVDMPGIGSGIERHDAAIFNYIHNGTAFVLVVDADQGSLRGSTMAFMNELSKYNMYPAVLVSKIDKKPANDIKEIVEYVQYQMTRLGNNNPYVGTVCSVNNNLEGFNNYLSAVNADALVTEKLSQRFKAIVNSVIDQLKIRIELRSKDVENADEKLKQIEEEISKVKAELPSYNSNADSPEKSAQEIIDNVCNALEEKSYDIAQMVIDKEDQESIKAVIVSIVRTAIISSLKEESEQYSTALGSTVQDSIKDLAAIEISNDFMEDYADIYKEVIGYIETLLDLGGIWGKIAKVLLPFLPDLLNWFFGKSDEEVLEEVRIQVMSKVVRQIATGIQPTILKITVDNQRRIQEKIQAELVSKMEKVKAGLKEKMDDANKTKEAVAEELSSLNSAIITLNKVIDEL